MKIYLAIPYAFNPDLSFRVANKVAAELMLQGHVVFSPVSHSHHLSVHLPSDLKFSNDFWMTQDLPLVEWADEVHVICIGEYGDKLIEASKGVTSEMNHAKLHGKPIKIIEHYD